MSWIKSTAALAVGLALVSCSKQEPQVSQVVPSTNVASTYAGPRKMVSLSLDAGFAPKESDGEARALNGSEFYRGRLRPYVAGDKANILLFLGSQTLNIFDKQSLEFDYDKETNSIHYRGNMSVPAGLLQAADLKMFMVAVDPSKLTDNTLTMRNVNTQWFENKEFSDGETLPISVPYFSDWLEVSKYVKGDLLDVARTKVTMRPQGHVIKMELSSNVTALQGVTAKALQVESTVISDEGTYTLPSGVSDIGVKPAFNPQLTAVKDHAGLKFRKFEIPLTESLEASKTRSIYLWVGPIVGADKKWTRTFANLRATTTILDHGFTTAGWDGHVSAQNDKLYAVYYTNSSFDRTGSTMSMKVDNTTVVSPIERMAYTYASAKNGFSNSGYSDAGSINAPFNLGNWPDRQLTRFTRYTWPWLEGQNYVGDNAQEFMLQNAPEPNSRNVNFRVPTLEEFRAILPTEAPNGQNKTLTVQEQVKLGNKLSSPRTYTSSYIYTNNVLGSKMKGFFGVRFMGGDDRYKTYYRYRLLSPGSPGTEAMQIQTFYLGAYYPEITTAQELADFQKNYPGAYLPNIPTERILSRSVSAEGDTTGKLVGGVRYWVNKSDQTNATYVEYNMRNGNIALKEAPKTNADYKHAVILVRDL